MCGLTVADDVSAFSAASAMWEDDETTSVVERDERLEALSGQTLVDRYRLLAVRARGSRCLVYEAEDVVLRRPVVVKVIAPEHAPAYRDALAATAGLSHPAFIAVYDLFEQDGLTCLIQELIDSRPLAEYLTEGAPVRRSIALAAQIARAIAYAHQHLVSHGDITPTSVMIDRSAVVYLNDAQLTPDWGFFSATAATIADAAVSGVSAEEMLQAIRADGEIRDIWSVGALLWLLLSSSSEGSTGQTYRADVPDDVRALVRRAVDVTSEGRFPTADDLALALESLEQSLSQVARQTVNTMPIAVRAYREARSRMGASRTTPPGVRRLSQPLDDDLFYDATVADFSEQAEPDSSVTRPADDALFAATLRRVRPAQRREAAVTSAPAVYTPEETRRRPIAVYPPTAQSYGADGWPDGYVAAYGGRQIMRTWVWTLIGVALFVASFLLGFLAFPQFHLF